MAVTMRNVQGMHGVRTMLGLAAAALAAAAVAQVAPPPAPQPPTPPPATVALPSATLTPIAIVYTPEEGGGRLQVEDWDEADPSLVGMAGARVDYFLVVPATIELRAGESFDLRTLVIQTHGLNGGAVGGAPLKLELEAPDGMLDLALARTNAQLAARAPGIARLWVESYLPRGTGTGEHYRLPVVVIVD
ncbi:MAG TPA: hypothetical protein VLD39_02685 [Gammaproteobacteria bacterium]|nr:hypothetical protein [Gammaproteobacteria bacterium]